MFEWLAGRAPVLIYLFLLLNSCFESLFPPYPSDAFVLVFSFLAGQGHFNIYLMYLFIVIGAMTGIMILYYVGEKKGDRLLALMGRTFLGSLFPAKMIEKAKAAFFKRGDIMVLLNRFLPGMRAPLCFAAGIVRIAKKKFFWYSLISVLFWNLFLVLVGFYVGSTWQDATGFLKRYNIIVFIVLTVLVVCSVGLYFWRRQNSEDL
jgi:membrane protein DedA with SNARE-associated domain